jgi:hypothetical protein
MKLLLFITLYFLNDLALQSQEKYFTKAPSGLNVRVAPSVTSNKIGKLPYGSILELIELTKIKLQIIDDGVTIDGYWVKVKFQNFPYIVSDREEDLAYNGEGYVFSEFIEKLNKVNIKTIEIDSSKFQSLYIPSKLSSIIKITSEEEAEKLLNGKVTWKNMVSLERVIDEIILDNGQVLKSTLEKDELSFIGYYPTEGIIVYEGGHGSTVSISIKTGESLETAGDPEYIIESPNKKMRLNGWFPGQECSSYFFQEKKGDTYRYLTDFGFGSDQFGENVCYFNKFCWLNDREFMYCYTDYSGEKGDEKYFIGKIIK